MQASPRETSLLQWPWLGFPATLPLCLPTPSITLLYVSTGHDLVRLTCAQTHTPKNNRLYDTNARRHASLSLFVSSPALQDLQGEVESYFLTIESLQSRQSLVLSAESISTVIADLWPSTTYLVSLHVSNGAHNTTGVKVNITTEDGGQFLFVGQRNCWKGVFLFMSTLSTTWREILGTSKFHTLERGLLLMSSCVCFTGDVKHIM